MVLVLKTLKILIWMGIEFLDENMKPYFKAAVGNYKTTMNAKYEQKSS